MTDRPTDRRTDRIMRNHAWNNVDLDIIRPCKVKGPIQGKHFQGSLESIGSVKELNLHSNVQASQADWHRHFPWYTWRPGMLSREELVKFLASHEVPLEHKLVDTFLYPPLDRDIRSRYMIMSLSHKNIQREKLKRETVTFFDNVTTKLSSINASTHMVTF